MCRRCNGPRHCNGQVFPKEKLMRTLVAVVLLPLAGCVTVEPGHRGLIFDPLHGGLQHQVLDPGSWRIRPLARLVDFDVTYSTRKEELRTNSSEGLGLELKVAVIYRPIVSELYELKTEVGDNFYE